MKDLKVAIMARWELIGDVQSARDWYPRTMRPDAGTRAHPAQRDRLDFPQPAGQCRLRRRELPGRPVAAKSA